MQPRLERVGPVRRALLAGQPQNAHDRSDGRTEPLAVPKPVEVHHRAQQVQRHGPRVGLRGELSGKPGVRRLTDDAVIRLSSR